MKWDHLSIDGKKGVESVSCVLCGGDVCDLLYFPRDLHGTEAERIFTLLKINPANTRVTPEEMGFCADCKHVVDELITQ